MIDPNYTPEKFIFTDADLENLCFHDCRIFAMAPEGNDLVMDIDYMFEWYEPEEGVTGFTHPISPCTLLFRNVEDMGMFFEGTYPDVSFIMQDFCLYRIQQTGTLVLVCAFFCLTSTKCSFFVHLNEKRR